MTHFWIIFIIIVAAILLTGSVIIIRHVYKRQAVPQEIKAAAFPIGVFLISMIVRMLRLPISEIIFAAILLLFSLFFIRHLSLWRKAKKLGCAISVGRTPTAILVVFIAFGLLFVSVGAVLLHFELVKQQRHSQFTQAVVVDYLRKSSTRVSSNSHSYYAIVEFHANGQTIRATSGMGWPDRRYKIGKELAIRYNPYDLHEILIKGDRNIMPVSFILFGLFFCAGIPTLIFTEFDGKRLQQMNASN